MCGGFGIERWRCQCGNGPAIVILEGDTVGFEWNAVVVAESKKINIDDHQKAGHFKSLCVPV